MWCSEAFSSSDPSSYCTTGTTILSEPFLWHLHHCLSSSSFFFISYYDSEAIYIRKSGGLPTFYHLALRLFLIWISTDRSFLLISLSIFLCRLFPALKMGISNCWSQTLTFCCRRFSPPIHKSSISRNVRLDCGTIIVLTLGWLWPPVPLILIRTFSETSKT